MKRTFKSSQYSWGVDMKRTHDNSATLKLGAVVFIIYFILFLSFFAVVLAIGE